MATAAKPYLLSAEEFLAIVWDDSDAKAELDRGVIRIMRMMAGGNADHSRVQGNVFAALRTKLKGSGCRPHGSDMAVRIDDFSIRYPDVSVYRGRSGPEDGKRQAFDDPRLIVEVLSATTREQDFEHKLPEYQRLASLEVILYVDPADEIVEVFRRSETGEWIGAPATSGADIHLPTLSTNLTWDEIFARD